MLFHINLHVCVLDSTRLNLIQASPTFPHKELPIVSASVNIRLLKKKKNPAETETALWRNLVMHVINHFVK